MTERQADQKWVEDTRAEYLRRTGGFVWREVEAGGCDPPILVKESV
jgi:hypothetical protein